jgi:hypothetical protein
MTENNSTLDCWWPSRYGAGDQLGTLNEITPAKMIAAARLVRQGVIYDLGHTLHAHVPRFEGRYWQQTLVSSAHIINKRKPGGGPRGWGRNQLNWITELVSGTLQIGTHLDGLNHLQIGDRFYNGWRADRSSRTGAPANSASRQCRRSSRVAFWPMWRATAALADLPQVR